MINKYLEFLRHVARVDDPELIVEDTDAETAPDERQLP